MTLDADDLFGPEDEYEALLVAAVDCPRCGHSSDDHDESGCQLCECTGP